MITFIELWSANDNWLKLNNDERAAYLSKMQPTIPAFLNKGATIISWGLNDKTNDHKGPYDYYAIWTFPDENLLAEFQGLLNDANWYHYFDQVNVCGLSQTPEPIIGHMMGL